MESDDYVSLSTGERVNDVVELVTMDKKKRQEQYKQFQQKRSRLRKLMERQCGNFYFYRYDKLLEQLDDDTATAFRFLYLCACADKDGYFQKNSSRNCSSIDDFINIFDAGKDTIRRYMETLINNKLLFKEDNGYKLNSIYYHTGKLPDEYKNNTIRTFNEAIKELYHASTPREHKMIGQILKLVPYINIYNNVLCWNIEETDKSKIQPLTFDDIRNIMRPKNKYNYEIMKKLEKLFVKGEPVLGNFSSVSEEQYIINPRVFYRGNDVNDLKAIIDQFDIAKNQYINKKKKKMMKKGEN